MAQIASDTKELQRALGTTGEQLSREVGRIEDAIFKEAKRAESGEGYKNKRTATLDATVGRQLYQLFTTIHQTFTSITQAVEERGRYVNKIASSVSRATSKDEHHVDDDTVALYDQVGAVLP